jgi:predicted Holliday junction resolvase-like endonuclease
MTSDLLAYYRIHRSIFGVCPCCNEIFRLSDTNIYPSTRPRKDWLDRHDSDEDRVANTEERLEQEKSRIRKLAQKKGQREANKRLAIIDTVFTPRKIDPNDVRVVFHPVDYMVFRGMEKNRFRSVLLLDRQSDSKDRRALQNSIEETINQANYDWLTLRIDENGKVSEE